MKNDIMKKLLYVAFCVVATLLAGCKPAVFSPVASPNPWADDYSAVSSMENYRLWGTYNVHDPSCRKLDDYYYMYSTDAIFRENREEAQEKGVPLGYIQVRRSQDLVHWDFRGWAFPEIPQEAVEWVHGCTGGEGATNIWLLTSSLMAIFIGFIIVCRLLDAAHPTSVWQSPNLPKALGTRWVVW